MKVLNLTADTKIYTSNVHLVLGTWNAIDDVNTLVDVGRDSMVIQKIRGTNTGVGKKKIDQVILTHSHYDHASLLPVIKDSFKPVVYAFSPLPGVDHLVKHGDRLRMGDCTFEVLHTPGHSNDSICLYCEENHALFVGDSPVVIQTATGSYEKAFVDALRQICSRKVESIYFGHGAPTLTGGQRLLNESLRNVRKSLGIADVVTPSPSQ